MMTDALEAVVAHHGVKLSLWLSLPSPIKQSHDLVADLKL